jgi:hypothetical protein
MQDTIDENTLSVMCPFCEMDVVITREHAINNDLSCCMNCNKAFSIDVSNIEEHKQ